MKIFRENLIVQLWTVTYLKNPSALRNFYWFILTSFYKAFRDRFVIFGNKRRLTFKRFWKQLGVLMLKSMKTIVRRVLWAIIPDWWISFWLHSDINCWNINPLRQKDPTNSCATSIELDTEIYLGNFLVFMWLEERRETEKKPSVAAEINTSLMPCKRNRILLIQPFQSTCLRLGLHGDKYLVTSSVYWAFLRAWFMSQKD